MKRLAIIYIKTAPWFDENKIRGKRWEKFGTTYRCEVSGNNWTQVCRNINRALKLLPFKNPGSVSIEIRGTEMRTSVQSGGDICARDHGCDDGH